MDEVVTGLARGKRCKTRVLLRNLTASGRRKFRRPGEFHAMDEIPWECQDVLDRWAILMKCPMSEEAATP